MITSDATSAISRSSRERTRRLLQGEEPDRSRASPRKAYGRTPPDLDGERHAGPGGGNDVREGVKAEFRTQMLSYKIAVVNWKQHTRRRDHREVQKGSSRRWLQVQFSTCGFPRANYSM